MFLGVMTKNQNKIRLKTKFGGDGCIDRTTNKKKWLLDCDYNHKKLRVICIYIYREREQGVDNTTLYQVNSLFIGLVTNHS